MSLWNLFRAEWLKLWAGRAWMVLTGVLLAGCVASGQGFLKIEAQKPDATNESVTATLISAWFMLELAAALITVLATTREYRSGSIGRTVLCAQSRGNAALAKLLAALTCGTLMGGLAVLGGILTSVSLLVHNDRFSFAWGSKPLVVSVGLFFVVVAGALWGLVVGLVVRSQGGAIAVLLMSAWLVGPLLQRVYPKVGRYVIDQAMASLYQGGDPGLLPIRTASVVVAIWLLVVGALGALRFMREDVR